MRSVTIIIAAAATIAAGAVNVPTTANAGCYGCGVGAGVNRTTMPRDQDM